MKGSIYLLLMLLDSTAGARVFDMGKETFGSFLRTSQMQWGQGQTPYSNSSGTGATFDSGFSAMPSYEFGFIWANQRVNWRFSFETILPQDNRGVKGSSSSGALWYTITSGMSVAIPKIGLEFNMKKWPKSRIYTFADWGLANLTISNGYTFTPAGTAQFPTPGADFREEMKASSNAVSAGLAFETLMSDTTTMAFDVGYRWIKFAQMKHNVSATTFQGAVLKGDTATDNNGNNRTLDLSGLFLGLSFRFWIF